MSLNLTQAEQSRSRRGGASCVYVPIAPKFSQCIHTQCQSEKVLRRSFASKLGVFFFSRSSQAQTQEWTQPRYNHDFIWQIARYGHDKSLTEQDQIAELPQKKAVDR